MANGYIKRFSSLLLSGKAATLPILMQQAYAATPTYQNILQSNFVQIEVPDSRLRLDTIGTSNTYGGFATVCTELPMGEMSVVLTGVKGDDTVFVATATNVGGNEAYHPNVKIGTQQLMTPIVTRIGGPAGSSMTVTVKLNMATLAAQGYPIATGGRFYLQSVAFPSGAVTSGSLDWGRARISPLDTISIGRCDPNAYGTTYF